MEFSLFSLVVGIALGTAGAFATGFLSEAGKDLWNSLAKRIWPKSDDPPQVVIQLADPPTTAFSSLAPSSIERVSAVSFHAIAEAIEKAPPMQRDRVAQAYQGIKVEWDSYFRTGHASGDDTIRVYLSADKNFMGKTIVCDVPANEYRELGILPEGSKVRISGEISRARSFEVELTDVCLQIFSEKAQA